VNVTIKYAQQLLREVGRFFSFHGNDVGSKASDIE
jgi:hypothetical protein